jgi:WD40 repeat protein
MLSAYAFLLLLVRWQDIVPEFGSNGQAPPRPRAPALSFQAHRRRINAIAFSATGETIATAGADRVIKFWDARTGAPK